MTCPIIVVGAGPAAASFVARHITLGNQHSLLLIGEEPHPPCQHPSLSKKSLLTEFVRGRLFIHPLELYAEQGVKTRIGTHIRKICCESRQVITDSGEIIDYDKLILCIDSCTHSNPNIELAVAAGLNCDNGIAVNENCQTSDPNIYAAGDCISFIRNGQQIQLESIQNASDQGDRIARVLWSEDVTYDILPWFWSSG